MVALAFFLEFNIVANKDVDFFTRALINHTILCHTKLLLIVKQDQTNGNHKLRQYSKLW